MKQAFRWVILPLLLAAVPGRAADADALVHILSPAYLAEDVAAVCSTQDPSLMEEGFSAFGSVHGYALHVRGEVVEGLSSEEVERVARRAAEAAKAAALLAIRMRSAGSPQEEQSNLIGWCRESAMPFVRQLVAEHDRNHPALDHMLDIAKRLGAAK